jgi:hypothetical protein
MIELIEIKDRGNLAMERVVFKVMEDGNIGSWMVYRARAPLEEGKRILKSTIYDAYWFWDKEISAGDLVILYTKISPVGYKKKDALEQNSHFFYWGKDGPLWNNENRAIVYGQLTNWKTQFIAVNDPSSKDIEPE